MAKKEKGILNRTYESAKKAIETGNRDLARDYFDFGIMHVANKRYNDRSKSRRQN
jgi:diketogulonate reductase-like aldo/keto reductase